MAMLRSLFLALPAAMAQEPREYSVGQCMAKPETKYENCWGDDLDWAQADSFEECCEKCASIDKCEVLTYDKWNHDGKSQNYCFFKSSCSNPKHSPTAMSGYVKRKSTTTFTTTSPAKSTSSMTPATTTTTTPAPTTSSTSSDAQPQCGKPHSVASLGRAGGPVLNVSSKEACCASCHAPSCSYVTYGKYANVHEEMWACYHHSSDQDVTAALRSRESGAFLTLYDDENEEASCAALGLSGCVGAAVVMPGPLPPTNSGWSTGAFVGAGVASFLVSVPLGYLVGRKLSFGTK